MRTNPPGTVPGILKPACPRCGNIDFVEKRVEPGLLDRVRTPIMNAKVCSNCGTVISQTPA